MRQRTYRYQSRLQGARSALKQTRRIAQNTLDGLPANIAILNKSGTIVAVNDQWMKFAVENTPGERRRQVVSSVGLGVNYLHICDNSRGKDSSEASKTALGIRSVASGCLTSFSLEYPCHSPSEKRWFNMRVLPLDGPEFGRVAIYHEDITRQRRAENMLKSERKRIAGKLLLGKKNQRIAETLQRSLLQLDADDRFAGMEISKIYVPASTEAAVGGDFYDVFSISRNQHVMVVGDLSGKGLVAAARIPEIKYALRALMDEHQQPNIALEKLNQFAFHSNVRSNKDPEAFVAITVAVINISTGVLTVSAAGAEPSLILRANGMSEHWELPGTPIGMLGESEYGCWTTEFEYGDTLIIATDGIAEARRNGEFLGIAGLARLAESFGPKSLLSDLAMDIYLGTLSYANGHLKDDVCLLLGRRQPEVSLNSLI